MAQIPTVKIEDPNSSGDFCIINESDYDKSIHVKWTEPKGKGSESDLAKMKRADLVERLEASSGLLADVTGTGKDGALKNSDIVDAIEVLEAAEPE